MTDTRNTPEQDYIIDHVGAENWQHVVDEFEGMSMARVLMKLDEMFPSEDIKANYDLAAKIWLRV